MSGMFFMLLFFQCRKSNILVLKNEEKLVLFYVLLEKYYFKGFSFVFFLCFYVYLWKNVFNCSFWRFFVLKATLLCKKTFILPFFI